MDSRIGPDYEFGQSVEHHEVDSLRIGGSEVIDPTRQATQTRESFGLSGRLMGSTCVPRTFVDEVVAWKRGDLVSPLRMGGS